jgi:hypothetical protein
MVTGKRRGSVSGVGVHRREGDVGAGSELSRVAAVVSDGLEGRVRASLKAERGKAAEGGEAEERLIRAALAQSLYPGVLELLELQFAHRGESLFLCGSVPPSTSWILALP